jgi:hypothetical protein
MANPIKAAPGFIAPLAALLNKHEAELRALRNLGGGKGISVVKGAVNMTVSLDSDAVAGGGDGDSSGSVVWLSHQISGATVPTVDDMRTAITFAYTPVNRYPLLSDRIAIFVSDEPTAPKFILYPYAEADYTDWASDANILWFRADVEQDEEPLPWRFIGVQVGVF